MNKDNLTEENLNEVCEDAFINMKEACMRLQEKTRCSDQVVIEMLDNLIEFYRSKDNVK